MSKVRIACVQYPLREIKDFAAFSDQVSGYVERAAKQGAEFICFPEYFSTQLLSLEATLPAAEGIKLLAAKYTEPLTDLMGRLATEHSICIIAGSHPVLIEETVENHSFIFEPEGARYTQPKLHTTPFEKNDWHVSQGNRFQIFQSSKAKVGVQICYDIEFAETSRRLAELGVDIIFVPYCTDDPAGHFRVSHCAQARAIENQVYVATAGLVGKLDKVTDMQDQYAQSGIYSPCDEGFPDNGIIALGDGNGACLLIYDLDLDLLANARENGAVTPRLDRRQDIDQIAHSS